MYILTFTKTPNRNIFLNELMNMKVLVLIMFSLIIIKSNQSKFMITK